MLRDYKEHERRMHLDARGVSQDLVHHSVSYCQVHGEAEYYVKGQRRGWRSSQ